MSRPLRIAILAACAAFPLLEIGLLIRLGQAIGYWQLGLLVIATAVLGTIVIRRIGLSILSRALQGLEAGRSRIAPLLDAFLQVIAGMLLIFPGPISDTLGILLLVPQVRKAVIRAGWFKVVGPIAFSFHAAQPAQSSEAEPPADLGEDSSVTIEGEYERISEEPLHARQAVQRRSKQA